MTAAGPADGDRAGPTPVAQADPAWPRAGAGLRRVATDRPAGLAAQPRIRLGTLPTPLLPAPRLSEAVGVEIWLKRDDLAGLGLGGNKVRGLEFLLADALARGCDTLITGGGPGSNWAMLAALAARTRGLDTVLVCYGDPVPPVGNMHLATTIGAEIRFTGDKDRASVDVEVAALADELRAAGRTPYPMGRGGATAVGDSATSPPPGSWPSSSPTRTVRRPPPGWPPARAARRPGSWRVRLAPGVGPRRRRDGQPSGRGVRRADHDDRAGGGRPGGRPRPGRAADRGRRPHGPGYGMRSPDGDAAAELVARTEGVFLDPIFAAKAMAGLLAAIRRGEANRARRLPGDRRRSDPFTRPC